MFHQIAQIKELVCAFGWTDLGDQKNSFMISFRHEESKYRLNIYYTTGTVTLQAPRSRFPKTWKGIDSLDKLEGILQNNK